MKIVRQVEIHNHDVFKLRVWKKKIFICGWYAEIKIGSRQWNVFPGRRARERQMPEKFVKS